jgi:hypothetical protein
MSRARTDVFSLIKNWFPMLIVGVAGRASVRQLCLLCALWFFVEDKYLPLICPTSQARVPIIGI